ncbi:hypothetical protein K439DRAFT_1616055 [Ramaria rubella]|nr:hypothetical protein K439DRAFT_1616055 [Ramaria rubella]
MMNRDPQPHPGIFNFNCVPTELEHLRSLLSPGHQVFMASSVSLSLVPTQLSSLIASSHFNFHMQALLLNLHAHALPTVTFFLHAEYEVERGRGFGHSPHYAVTIHTETLLIRPDCRQVQTQLPMDQSFLGRYTVPALETSLEHVVTVPPSHKSSPAAVHGYIVPPS